ncbi:LINE-1 reverse transcriptase isogeny [Gossypium australe]|uniref:LINE-1 reverse transcriptase isogeny n=1 Tax=Gossypium australe TaxID=47621 RepID=A0A5B6VLB6_9ROSI|nr:LINE-1 reverse transcriptase isogeny [Gossypium australe]
MHPMRSKHKKWMAIKIHLEKAYDRVSWDFIGASLQVANTLDFLRKVIMFAITSSTMQILWNGVPTQKFRPVRCIKQECPLSPYLFVLCMDWLDQSIIRLSKVTLAQSVLLTIPTYFMQSLKIPQGICDEIESIVRQFIWGSSGRSKRMVFVNWDSVCQSKSCGGLGIRQLKDQNSSFLLKLGFTILTKPEVL